MSRNATKFAVSVVIPTHNPRREYLERMLEALRGQTLPREQWEIIVVDNGSRVPLRAAGPRDQETAESARQVAAQPTDKRPKDEEPSPRDSTRRSRGQTKRQETGDRSQRSEIGEQRSDARQGDLKLTKLKHNTPELELGWHPNARIVREEELGLTFARLRGFAEAKGELIVMVDDDNVLVPDYLETAVRIAQEQPALGAFGGKCLPEFEVEPEPWLEARGKGLGLRDRGEREEFFPEATIAQTGQSAVGSWQDRASGQLNTVDGQPATNRQRRAVREFPDCAPIGAGMVLRRDAAAAYAASLHARGVGLDGISVRQCFSRAVGNSDLPKDRIAELPKHRAASVITDRKGDSLASGGDNDICLTVIEEGWQVGYLPQLQLMHLIPERRMTLGYHKRMARDSMKSFILMLDQHGIRPWSAMSKWTLPLRVASDWWRVKPWQGPEQSLSFWGNIGMYEGRAALARQRA